MKRGGKVFLVIVLVMAMVWTSMGTSNGLGVFAKSIATTQSSETEFQDTSTKQEDTETEKTDFIEEDTTNEEKKQQSVMQDTSAEQNTTDAGVSSPEVKQIDIANNITDVDMTVIINGERVKVAEMSTDTRIPAGSSVDITIGYGNVEQVSEGSTLYYQLPKQIKADAAQSGTLTEGDEKNKIEIGSFTFSETGRVEITFTSDYIQKCGGTIQSGQFWVSGSFSEDCGTNGTETILFGQQQVMLNFENKEQASEATTATGGGAQKPGGSSEAPKDPETTTSSEQDTQPEVEKKFGNLTITKKVVGNNIPSEDYQIEVKASEDNTNKDLTKVIVKDTSTDKEIARTIESLSFTLKAGQKVEVQNLPVGKYSVQEKTSKDAQYTASYSETEGTVTVTDGKTESITITNTYKTELYVVNKDTASNIVLSGSELAIYKASDVDEKGNVKDGAEPVKTWKSESEKTDVTGSVKANESYVLVEKNVTGDYEKAQALSFMVDEKGEVSVDKDNAEYYDDATHTITLDNKKRTGTLSVKKVIEDGEENDAFDFTVIFADFNNNHGGNVTVTRNGKDSTETVGTDGKLEVKDLTNNEIVKIAGIPYGTAYTVTETQKEGYLETENSGLTGVIGDDSAAGEKAEDTQVRVVNAEASITNTRLNGFTIKNLVKSSVPESVPDEKPTFKFKVTLTKNGEPYTGEFSLKYSEKNETETLSQKDSKEPGVYEDIELGNMQSVTFSNLPSGVKYTVEESVQDQYESSVEVKNGDGIESAADEDEDKSAGVIAEGAISKAAATIEFTNIRKVGSISLTNTVKGTLKDKEESQKYAYYIEVGGKPLNEVNGVVTRTSEKNDTAKQDNTVKQADSEAADKAEESLTISDGQFSLSDKETVVIENLPAGVSYKIQKVKEEKQNQKYVTSVDDNTGSSEKEGTIEAGKTVAAQFTNQVLHLNVEVQFAKSETEKAPEPEATFTLYNKDDVDDNGKVKDGVKVAKDRTFSTKTESSHDFQDVIEPGKSYVLVEKEAPAGHTHAENVSFEVSNAGITTAQTDKNGKSTKLDDKNNYTYPINHDLITVSIKKTDTSGNGLADARLLLKQGKEKILSWTSKEEKKELNGELNVGEYTLSEVIAPSGYEIASDISFKINQDGTVSVDGKTVPDNVITMKDEAVSGEETGKIVVNNLITYGGNSQAVVKKTFYVALFSDADCEKKVSDVRELKCEGTWSAYTVFENLKDGVYYVAQTDEDGNKLDSPEGRNVTGNGYKCEITSAQKITGAVISNELTTLGDDFINTRHSLTVTKNVTINGNPISDKFNGTFYVSIFTDPYYTNRAIDTYITELKVENGQSGLASFTNLSNGTYYVAETDAEGNPVENSNFDFDVTYTGDTKISFTNAEENTEQSLAIVNDMKQSHADYQKYITDNTGGDDNTPGTGDDDSSNDPSDTDDDSSDIDDGDSDDDNTDDENDAEGTGANTNKRKSTGTTSKKNTTKSSSNTTKKSKSAKTGDASHIVFYALAAVIALIAGVGVYFRKRRETE